MNNNRSVSAAIGEYLVLGELLKRNHEAYLAHGETQKGWDVVVIDQDAIHRVQVKTIDWPNQLAVNGTLTQGFDYLVVVLLDRQKPRSRFFVFAAADLPLLLSAPNKARAGGKRTLTMSQKSMAGQLEAYEDAWGKLVPRTTSHLQAPPPPQTEA